jgi:hypothetical protein
MSFTLAYMEIGYASAWTNCVLFKKLTCLTACAKTLLLLWDGFEYCYGPSTLNPFFSIKVRWHDSMTFAERKKIDLLPEHHFFYNFALLMVFLLTFLNFVSSLSIPILIQRFSVLQSGTMFWDRCKKRSYFNLMLINQPFQCSDGGQL